MHKERALHNMMLCLSYHTAFIAKLSELRPQGQCKSDMKKETGTVFDVKNTLSLSAILLYHGKKLLLHIT